jgi:exopolyphosphatase/guanosine-5'-triphosphate,3'-diphosphate pyrophosphatase
MKITTLGAIDIGSNAIRLLVKNVEDYKTHKEFKKVTLIRIPIRLGEDVFTKGEISQEKQEALYQAMEGYSLMLKAYNVERYRACATSAMREAKNGKEIIDNIKKRSGISVEIINGIEEGSLIYEAGEVDKYFSKKDNYIYVDVGGGSTEVILYNGSEKESSNSFKLGTVRMLNQATSISEMADFIQYLQKIKTKYHPVGIIGSGGNINKVHKLLEKKESEVLTDKEIIELYETLRGMSVEERIENYKLNPNRADVIVPALEIFSTVCKIANIKNIIVPRIGLSDGIIHHLEQSLD